MDDISSPSTPSSYERSKIIESLTLVPLVVRPPMGDTRRGSQCYGNVTHATLSLDGYGTVITSGSSLGQLPANSHVVNSLWWRGLHSLLNSRRERIDVKRIPLYPSKGPS